MSSDTPKRDEAERLAVNLATAYQRYCPNLRALPDANISHLYVSLLRVINDFGKVERELASLRSQLATMRPFFEKYALGPKQRPSCLVCGRDDYAWPPAIQHLELPGIVVCHPCRDARSRYAGVGTTHQIVPVEKLESIRIFARDCIDTGHDRGALGNLYAIVDLCDAMLSARPSDKAD